LNQVRILGKAVAFQSDVKWFLIVC
jgi:hypothetical protein